MYKSEGKIIFPFKCPVCGKSSFNNFDWLLEEEKDIDAFEIDSKTGNKRRIDAIEAHFIHCEYCGWVYDLKQVLDYNNSGDRNKKSVIELREQYNKKILDNPNYNFDAETEKPIPHKCPICGKYEFKDTDSYDVCKVCGWIDDGTEGIPFDDFSEVNKTSIKKAKEDFQKKNM